MAATVESGEQHPAARPRTSSWRRTWLRAPVAAVLVGALVAVLVAGRWWMTSSSAFDQTVGIQGAQRGVDPGTSANWYALDRLPAVHVTRVEVVLAPTSTPAATSVSLCEPGSGLGGGQKGDLSTWCIGAAPMEGADLASWPEGTFGALTVVPLTPGEAQVVGVRVWFEDGWRTGVRTVPVTLTISTGPVLPLG